MILNFKAMDPPPRDKLGGDPIEIAGLFEGDIAGVSGSNMAVGKSGATKVSIVFVFLSYSLFVSLYEPVTFTLPNDVEIFERHF